MKRFFPLLALAVLIVGCNNDSANAPKTGAGGGKSPVAATGDAGAQGKTETPASPRREDVPSSLKTAAFEYFGLERETSPTMELSGGAGDSTGSLKNELVAIESEVARYKQTWTGGLSFLGVTEIEVRPDGVYSLALNDSKLDKPQLDLPADVTPGKTWAGAGKLQVSGASIESSENKVVGPRKLKTKVGEYDAMVITSTVKMTQDKKPKTVKMTMFLVKGVGPVRVEMAGTDAAGKPTQTVLQIVEKP